MLQETSEKLLEVVIGKSYGYFDPLTGEIRRPFTVVGLSPISDYIKEKLEVEISNMVNLKYITKIVDLIRCIPGIRILSHCGFYMWILLYALCMMNKYRINRLLLLPVLGFIVGLIASPVNAYFRYSFPIVVIAPFLILMVYSIRSRCELNRKD